MLVTLGQNPNQLLWDNPWALFLVREDSVVLSLLGSTVISDHGAVGKGKHCCSE